MKLEDIDKRITKYDCCFLSNFVGEDGDYYECDIWKDCKDCAFKYLSAFGDEDRVEIYGKIWKLFKFLTYESKNK